ncbi:MAG: EamA family transporter [Hyphomicrobiaceae bacterium]|nr:EamA family transporter [Hyphomicrobiaceae bacterium]
MLRTENTKPISLTRELLLLALLSLLWGASYGLIKIAVATITPVTLVGVRVLIASVLLWAVVLYRRCEVPTSPRIWSAFCLQSVIGYMLPFTMITWGQQFVDSGLAGILNSTTPIFVFLITLVWTRQEAVSLEKAFGVLAGLGGVVFLVGLDALKGLGSDVFGQLAITGATVSYALAMIYGRRFSGIAPEVTAAATLTIAVLVMLPASFILEKPTELMPSRASIMALFALASLSTAAAFILYFRLVNTLGALGTSSVAYARAAVSVLIGVMLLNEALTWQIATGFIAIVVGVAAINQQCGTILRYLRGKRLRQTSP